MYTSPFISLYKKRNLRGQKQRKTATTREFCRGHEEGILTSKTWKLVVFILTWVDSWQHRAMKCFRRAWCEQKMCEKISENKELGSEPWGVATVDLDNHNKQSHTSIPSLYYFSYTIANSHKGDAGRRATFSSVHPFFRLRLCAWSQNWKKTDVFWSTFG